MKTKYERAPLRETVRISAEILNAYRQLAREDGRTLSGLIDLILRNELEELTKTNTEREKKRDGYKNS